jgi:hypothetical protein
MNIYCHNIIRVWMDSLAPNLLSPKMDLQHAASNQPRIVGLNRSILAIWTNPNLDTEAKQRQIHDLIAATRIEYVSSGASITYFTRHYAPQSKIAIPLILRPLSLISLALSKRLKPDGQTDGIAGSAGGLAKRIGATKFDPNKYEDEKNLAEQFGEVLTIEKLKDASTHERLNISTQEKILRVFDDIILDEDGALCLTDDIQIIRQKNIAREMQEELGSSIPENLRAEILSTQSIEILSSIQDDQYLSTPQLWQSNFENKGLWAYPVDASVYAAELNARTYDKLLRATRHVQNTDGEILGLMDVPLMNALLRISSEGTSKGYDPDFHFRYTHEALIPWVLACRALHHNTFKMRELVRFIAPSFRPSNPLDFEKIAAQLGKTLEDLDHIFGLKSGSCAMLQACLPPRKSVTPPPPHGDAAP